MSYVYDELGRLRAVLDPASDTAVYNYDSVGNLLSISRQSSSVVSIIEFTPKSGPVGTAVTISGTGFSATASQNAVAFNGTAAVVTSATATKIVTTVPAGATTGPITVTTPTGSASSGAAFTVTDSTGAPTITRFTPTIGTPGTPVTIEGSNFEPVAANNRVVLNISHAHVSSSTSTAINTTVPSRTGSGRISVTTRLGKATSSADFFVPPAPYTATDVEFTGRMALGETKTVTINSAGKIGLVVFDASAGQRVSLFTNSSTIGSCGSGTLSILKPDGTTLASVNLCGSSFLEPQNLAATGTYAVFVDPPGTSTGSVTITLSNVPPDIAGTITVDGPAVTVTTTVAGQNASLTFSGAAGQRVALQASNVTYGASPFVIIYKPAADGSTSRSSGEVWRWWMESGSWTDVLTLPQAGTYTIFIDPQGTTTGSITLALWGVPPDATGTIAVGGSPLSVTITTPGQNGEVNFSGTQGQQVTVRVTNNTICGVAVSLYRQNGTTQLTGVHTCSASFNLATQTLPATETYRIKIDPTSTATGSLNISVTSP